MDSTIEYRAKAIEALREAGCARNEGVRTELLNIAAAYARLADHAEREGKHYAHVAHAGRSAMQ